MSEFLKMELEKIKGKTYITDIPIEEFESIEELTEFIKVAKKSHCGTVLHYETSNFHQGVVVQLFDIVNCEAKDCIGTVEECREARELQKVMKPIGLDMCTCPKCGTYNEVIEKRRKTVNQDIVLCWHCGQAIEIRRSDSQSGRNEN